MGRPGLTVFTIMLEQDGGGPMLPPPPPFCFPLLGPIRDVIYEGVVVVRW